MSLLPVQQKGKQAGVAPFSSQHLEQGASAARACSDSPAGRLLPAVEVLGVLLHGAGDSCTVHMSPTGAASGEASYTHVSSRRAAEH